MGLYMLEHNFRSWNRTTSVESDSFKSWKFTLKVGTGWNRNIHVGIQLIDDGKRNLEVGKCWNRTLRHFKGLWK